MDCAEEVAVLKKAVGPVVSGEERLTLDVLNGRMTVQHGASETSTDAILKAVATTGMGAAPWEANAPKGNTDDYRRQHLLFTAASGVAALVGMALHVWSSDSLTDVLRLFVDHASRATAWLEITAYIVAALLGARFALNQVFDISAPRRNRFYIHRLTRAL